MLCLAPMIGTSHDDVERAREKHEAEAEAEAVAPKEDSSAVEEKGVVDKEEVPEVRIPKIGWPRQLRVNEHVLLKPPQRHVLKNPKFVQLRKLPSKIAQLGSGKGKNTPCLSCKT